jgi:hypothetical protein
MFAPLGPCRASTFHDGLGNCHQGAARRHCHRARLYGERWKSLVAISVLFYSSHSSLSMSQSNLCVSVTCEVDSPLLNFEKHVVYLKLWYCCYIRG